MNWDLRFTTLFDKCLQLHRSGDVDYTGYYQPDDCVLLDEIGYAPREFFDFVEDCSAEGEPALSTALLIAAVRRDYFLVVQKGVRSSYRLAGESLPGVGEALGGLRWLPRILAKARAKLRGELDPDMMYGCGGDRHFLAKHHLHAADFLRAVWAAGDDDQKVLSWIAAQR